MDKEVRTQLEEKKKELLIFCLANKIPMFAVFADETDNGTEYNNITITPHEIGVSLSEDKITKYSASLNKHFEIRFKTHAKTEDKIEDAIDSLLDEEDL